MSHSVALKINKIKHMLKQFTMETVYKYDININIK